MLMEVPPPYSGLQNISVAVLSGDAGEQAVLMQADSMTSSVGGQDKLAALAVFWI